ncbi:MAG: hypothetical protein R2844_16330 [Caldilineales bacterium]
MPPAGQPAAGHRVGRGVKLLPPAELLGRLHGPWLLSTDGLRDVSARQKTLRGAIGWSYDLLSPVEQTLFRRLSVFAGGFTLQAAEMVCGEENDEGDQGPTVLDGVALLLERNLVQRETGLYGETRYAMLETVREFGLESLAVSGEEDALRARHASSFLQLVENANQMDPNPRRLLQNRLIDDEIHNMRAAHAWAIQHARQTSLLITAYLASWYRQRGPYAEAIHLIDKILALPGALDPTIARARVLYEAGIIMLYKGEVVQARAMFEECLAISTYFGYDQGKADALTLLGRMALWWLQDSAAANRYLENALACYRELKSPSGVSWALFFLTKVALVRGDFVRAQKLGEENLAIAQREGLGFTWPLNRLGEVSYANGDLGRARSLFEESMAIERQSGDSHMSVETHLGLTLTTIRLKDFDTARACLDRMLGHYEKLGNDRIPTFAAVTCTRRRWTGKKATTLAPSTGTAPVCQEYRSTEMNGVRGGWSGRPGFEV